MIANEAVHREAAHPGADCQADDLDPQGTVRLPDGVLSQSKTLYHSMTV